MRYYNRDGGESGDVWKWRRAASRVFANRVAGRGGESFLFQTPAGIDSRRIARRIGHAAIERTEKICSSGSI